MNRLNNAKMQMPTSFTVPATTYEVIFLRKIKDQTVCHLMDRATLLMNQLFMAVTQLRIFKLL